MNDFTKEELQLIHAYMFGGSYIVSAKELSAMQLKIQSMIDKYCELGECLKCNKDLE